MMHRYTMSEQSRGVVYGRSSRLLEMYFWKDKSGGKVVRSSMGLDSGFG